MTSDDIDQHPGVIIYGALNTMLSEIPAADMTAKAIVTFLQEHNLILLPMDAMGDLMGAHEFLSRELDDMSRELDMALNVVEVALHRLGSPAELIAKTSARRASLAATFGQKP